MIELFDPARLLPQRDRSLRLTAAAALAGLLGVAGHAGWLAHQLSLREAEHTSLRVELARRAARAASVGNPATPALITDLRARAEHLEAELAAANGGGEYALSAVQWLDRLDALSGPDVSLERVEIDRAGSARLEGMARTPSALSAYVQAWDRLPELAPVRARTIEVRQDPQAAPALHFELRAAAARPQP